MEQNLSKIEIKQTQQRKFKLNEGFEKNIKERNLYKIFNNLTGASVGLHAINPNLGAYFFEESINLATIASRKKKGKKTDILFLEGPPGTGKTYALNYLLKTFMEDLGKEDPKINIHNIENKIIKGILEEYNLKEFEHNVALNKLLEGYSDYIEGLKEIKEKIEDHEIKENIEKAIDISKIKLINLFNYLAIKSKNPIKEFSKKDIYVKMEVAPSLDSVKDIKESVGYILRKKELPIIEEKQEFNILDLIEKAYDNNLSLLIIDEFSELPKEGSEDKKAKALHELIDDYRDGKLRLSIDYPNLSEKAKETLDRLADQLEEILNSERYKELFVGDDEYIKEQIYLTIIRIRRKEANIDLPLPKNFIITSTGNVRDEYSPVGFTESTLNRIEKIEADYMPPKLINRFLFSEEGFVNKLIRELDKESNLSEEQKNRIRLFSKKVLETYKILYESYMENRDEWANKMLPSIRMITGSIKQYTAYLLFKDKIELKNINKITVENEFGSRAINRIEIKEQKIDKLPPIEEIDSFLISMIMYSTNIPVSSYTTTSETLDSKLIEMQLSEKAKSINEQINDGNLYSVRVNDSDYIYSKAYYLYLVSTASAILSGQRFFYYIGKSHEGKTTIARNILPNIVEQMNKSLNLYESIEVVSINAREFSLEKSNVETEGKKEKLNETKLIRTIRSISQHPERLYLVVVDEIDLAGSTQQLNSILTQNQVKIGDEIFDISNARIIGTSNISKQFLDNLISRSVIPYTFVPELGKIEDEIEGKEVDKRNIAFTYNYLKDIFGEQIAKEVVFKIVKGEEISNLMNSRLDIVHRFLENGKIVDRLITLKEIKQDDPNIIYQMLFMKYKELFNR